MPYLSNSLGATNGATAAEIVAIAQANIGTQWTTSGCVMLTYAVSNLAGVPFFNRADNTIAGNPLSVQAVDLVVPHSWNTNIAGDGWSLAWSGTSAAGLRGSLRPGDIVRVYHAGNPSETSDRGNWAGSSNHSGAHSFIVESVSNGNVTVIDNWGGRVTRHSLDDVITYYAPNGAFQGAYVSRLDAAWVAANVAPGIAGNGFGDFSGITGAPVVPDNAGNSFATASVISLGTTIIGAVGSGTDTNDYWKFTASTNGTVTVRLSDLAGDIDLRAFGSGGSQIAASTNGGSTAEQITFTVVAGQTYILQADPYQTAASDYRLTTTFTPAVSGVATEGANAITGNSLHNRLSGLGGNDTIYGMGGNDTLSGDSGNDVLSGGSQNDHLYGGIGNDYLYGGSENDRLYGGAGSDTLFGGTQNDGLSGGSDNDLLYGGSGNDRLFGGDGKDRFVFNTGLGSTNIDQITDFNVVDDLIYLDDAIFTGIATGALRSSAFAANSTGYASDTLDRIIYETDTGRLYFDADGTGAGSRVHFATLASGLSLFSADFVVY